MRRFILMSTFALVLAGCVAVQRTDDAGNLVLDEQGEPIVDQKFNAGKLAEGAGTVGMLLPPPWNTIAPIIGSLVVALKRKS